MKQRAFGIRLSASPKRECKEITPAAEQPTLRPAWFPQGFWLLGGNIAVIVLS